MYGVVVKSTYDCGEKVSTVKRFIYSCNIVWREGGYYEIRNVSQCGMPLNNNYPIFIFY